MGFNKEIIVLTSIETTYPLTLQKHVIAINISSAFVSLLTSNKN
jgi:hypothetical protein